MTTATNSIPRKFYRLIATASDGSTLEIYRAGEGGYLTHNMRTGEYVYATADILNKVRVTRIDY